MIQLDGGRFGDATTHLLGALALATATGQAIEIAEVGRLAGQAGLAPLHLVAVQALAALCGATVEGDSLGSKRLRFAPQHPVRAHDLIVDPRRTVGRPVPDAVTPLAEALLTVLARAGEPSLVRLRGTTVAPAVPSGLWLREVLAPMLGWLGVTVAAETERWGWFPDGGGEMTLLVEPPAPDETAGRLEWDERGDVVALWARAALSPRQDERVGWEMINAFRRALAALPLGRADVDIEIERVRARGPGSGLFVVVQFEQTLAGFEAMRHRGLSATQVAEEVADALEAFFWSDAAFEPELARALMLPLALGGRTARYTTSEITLPMRVLADLLPRFLPVTVSVDRHPAGGLITLRPAEKPAADA